MALGHGRFREATALFGAVGSAVALTGAAFFTVQHATCDDPGMYVRYDSHVELIRGCVDPAKVPEAPRPQQETGAVPNAELGD